MPDQLRAVQLWWIAAGILFLGGIVLPGGLVARGRVGVVAPIVACEGAIAAALDAARMRAKVAAALQHATVGVAPSAMATGPSAAGERATGTVEATLSPLCFGGSVFAYLRGRDTR